MEREMERCGNAKISVELERVPNKNAFYWERDDAFHWERDNAFHWELKWFAQRLWCYSMLTKFFEVLPKKVHCFSLFHRQLHQIVEWQVSDFVLCVIMARCGPPTSLIGTSRKNTHWFRLPQNGTWCTESSNFSGEKIFLSSTTTKTRRLVFWLPITDLKQLYFCKEKW